MYRKEDEKIIQENIEATQKIWEEILSGKRTKQQPRGANWVKPGEKSETGAYYHIVLKNKEEFDTFRIQSVGRPGHSKRVAGLRNNGSWDTQKWLIKKEDAFVKGNTLISNDERVKKILEKLGSPPKLVKGNIFKARAYRKKA